MIIKTIVDKERAAKFINSLNLEKPWSMECKPHKKDRSSAQNRLYRLRLKYLEDNGPGYEAEEWHIIFANKFLEPVVVSYGGQRYEVRKSTTKLNVKEFSEYLDKIDRWCIEEFNIILPAPEDLYYEAMGIRR